MTDFRPMLAAKANPDKLKFPLIVQPKLDGIRASVVAGRLLTRTLKEVPNRHVFKLFSRPEFEGFDGELILGDPTAPDAFRQTTSAVMRHSGEPPVTYYVFDCHNSPDHFLHRFGLTAGRIAKFDSIADIRLVSIKKVRDEQELASVEAAFLAEGHEGAILRDPNGLYKFGRGSVTKGDLLKLKRFEDSEAEIIGVEEEMHNANDAKTNALGRTERSTSKDGLVGKGRLGALVVRDVHTGVEFKIGTGFDAATRSTLWNQHLRDQTLDGGMMARPEGQKLVGSIVKYRFFATGVKDKPRFPSFLGFRDRIDFDD